MITIGYNLDIPYTSGVAVMGSNMASICSVPVPTFVFEAGEGSKNIETLTDILEFMADNEVKRTDTLYAVGGGVTGDIGGLAAALYSRGIKLVQIPTTLLAMVDSSVGGKVAVNLSRGKNMAGTFKDADDIYMDLRYLEYLPKRIYNEGMAEVIKYSFICGEDLTSLDTYEMVSKCVSIKEKIVSEDKLDMGKRRILNFGHTIGHAVEIASCGNLLHGEAVAIGMVYITSIFAPHLLPMLKEMLNKFSLPTEYNGSFDISLDKKRSGNSIDIVVPYDFGDLRVETYDFEEFRNICRLT